MKIINIRVYGIFINARREVLVTDEYRLGHFMTKFPGGGLEIGEGLHDCLKRECREELGMDIEILDHFYTTDFFQSTFLLPEPQQLISVYYRISFHEPYLFPVTETKFDFPPEEGRQTFRFIPLEELTREEMTFPIDKEVVKRLRNGK